MTSCWQLWFAWLGYSELPPLVWGEILSALSRYISYSVLQVTMPQVGMMCASEPHKVLSEGSSWGQPTIFHACSMMPLTSAREPLTSLGVSVLQSIWSLPPLSDTRKVYTRGAWTPLTQAGFLNNFEMGVFNFDPSWTSGFIMGRPVAAILWFTNYHYGCSYYSCICIVNPRRACAATVTVIVCLSLCVCVCVNAYSGTTGYEAARR